MIKIIQQMILKKQVLRPGYTKTRREPPSDQMLTMIVLPRNFFQFILESKTLFEIINTHARLSHCPLNTLLKDKTIFSCCTRIYK